MHLQFAFPKTASRQKFICRAFASNRNRSESRTASRIWARRRAKIASVKSLYNYFRDYDPSIGRYVQSDPIRMLAGVNFYAYVDGNPIPMMDPYGLWAVGDSLPPEFVDFAGGFGDVLTFGLTRRAREAMDIGSVDACSGAYAAGEIAGVVASVATGYGAGTKVAARFVSPNNYSNFSHSLTPNTVAKGSTWSKAGNRLNGDYIPTSGKRGDLHDLMDATAAGVGMKAAERAAFVPWSPARRAVNRIPYTPGAAGYGAGSYGLNHAGGGGC